jgi:sRNA-binding regulator protein Hfq
MTAERTPILQNPSLKHLRANKADVALSLVNGIRRSLQEGQSSYWSD